jgi:hypothetical protein
MVLIYNNNFAAYGIGPSGKAQGLRLGERPLLQIKPPQALI